MSKAIKTRLPLLLLDHKNKASSSHQLNCEDESDESHLKDQSCSSPNRNRLLLQWKEAFFNAFKQMDEEIKMVEKVDYSFSGSTAVVALKQVFNKDPFKK